MLSNVNKVLFLGAHTDDEMSCSASLARFIEEGKEVFVCVFSFCEESVPQGFHKNILRDEFYQSMKVLGVKTTNMYKHEVKVRYFKQHRQDILEWLVSLREEIKPDLVILPSSSDIHQDHNTIHREGVRAFNRHASIFGYENPYNDINFKNSCTVKIEDRHFDIKMNSINCYKSQGHRTYVTSDFLKGLAKVRGVQAGVELAECFEVIKLRV